LKDPYKILAGAIDIHVHGLPDLLDRPLSEYQIAKQAEKRGYRGILFKSHFTTNAPRLSIIERKFETIKLFSNITLNLSVGGINSEAVFSAIQFGVSEVKMPTVHATHHLEIHGFPTYPWSRKVKLKERQIKGIKIFDEDGKLVPQLLEILDMVAESNVILGTGHLSLPETMALVKEANSTGVKKIVITHADLDTTLINIEDQKKLANMGAIIEHSFTPCMPLRQRLDPRKIAEAIKAVGASRCVMSSDFGQIQNPLPVEGLRIFVEMMKSCGVTEEEIALMIKDNPAKLLDLE